MRILLATDGSECSDLALDALVERPWPNGTEVCVLSVAYLMPYIEDPYLLGSAIQYRTFETEAARAAADAERAAATIRARAPELPVTVKTAEGSASAAILEEAERWGADLVLVGSHGRGAATRFLLGSVSQTLALHAPCSVEIVRRRKPAPAAR
jgi:nucleotide-binding universal stress UspA family protein